MMAAGPVRGSFWVNPCSDLNDNTALSHPFSKWRRKKKNTVCICRLFTFDYGWKSTRGGNNSCFSVTFLTNKGDTLVARRKQFSVECTLSLWVVNGRQTKGHFINNLKKKNTMLVERFKGRTDVFNPIPGLDVTPRCCVIWQLGFTLG